MGWMHRHSARCCFWVNFLTCFKNEAHGHEQKIVDFNHRARMANRMLVYGYYYVVSTLALPEPYDEYARNWGFQLLMFSIFRLPFLFVALLLLIGLEMIALDLWRNRGAAEVRH